MSDTEGKTWQDRKNQVRKAYQRTLDQLRPVGEAQTTAETPGSAPSPDAMREVFSVMAGVPPSATSDTSATATAVIATPSSPPESLTPAESTKPDSAPSMVWMVPPTGFVEANLRKSIVEPNGSLVAGLAPWVRESLQRLATARHEPVEEVVYQIAEFFIEAEDERAEMPMRDVLEFYCANYVGNWV